MIDVTRPTMAKLGDAAALKGVVLDIRAVPSSANTIELVAAALRAEIGQVVTATVFVADRPGGILVAIVHLASGRNSVDRCLLAAVAGEVSLRAATSAEALELTDHLPGEIPPFGYGRSVRTLMDGDLDRYEWVWARSGSAGELLHLGPRTLRVLSSAVIVPIGPGSRVWDPAGIERRLGSDRRHALAGTPLVV